jgi:hypothetical protein
MKNVLPSRDDAGQPSSAGELKFGLAPGLVSSIRFASDHEEKGPSSAFTPLRAARGATASRTSHAMASAATRASATVAAGLDQPDLDLCIVNLPVVDLRVAPRNATLAALYSVTTEGAPIGSTPGVQKRSYCVG